MGWCSIAIAVEFGDRFPGALVVDQRFAVGRGGDQRGNGGIVERARQPTAGFVQTRARIVGDLSRGWDYAEVRGGMNCWSGCMLGIITGSPGNRAGCLAGGTVLAPGVTTEQCGPTHAV